MCPGYFYIAALILKYRDFPAFKGVKNPKKPIPMRFFRTLPKFCRKGQCSTFQWEMLVNT